MKDNNKYVLFKQNGTWCGTNYKNYSAPVQDANKIQKFNNFKNPDEIISYLQQYAPRPKEDFIVENGKTDVGAMYEALDEIGGPSDYVESGDIVDDGGYTYEIVSILDVKEDSGYEVALAEAINADNGSTEFLILLNGDVDWKDDNLQAAREWYDGTDYSDEDNDMDVEMPAYNEYEAIDEMVTSGMNVNADVEEKYEGEFEELELHEEDGELYDDNGEHWERCEWCDELYPESELRHTKGISPICYRCIQAIESHNGSQCDGYNYECNMDDKRQGKKEGVNAGMWSVPFDSTNSAKSLVKVLESDINSVGELKDKIYDLIGSDELYNELDDLGDDDVEKAKEQVRFYVLETIDDYRKGKIEQNPSKKAWDEKAIQYLEKRLRAKQAKMKEEKMNREKNSECKKTDAAISYQEANGMIGDSPLGGVIKQIQNIFWHIKMYKDGMLNGVSESEAKEYISHRISIATEDLKSEATKMLDEAVGKEVQAGNDSEKSYFKITYQVTDNIYSSFIVFADSEDSAREMATQRKKDKPIVGIKEISKEEVEELKKRGMSVIE